MKQNSCTVSFPTWQAPHASVPVRFSRDKVAVHCSMCDRRRTKFVRVYTATSSGHFSFCSYCIRGLARSLRRIP